MFDAKYIKSRTSMTGAEQKIYAILLRGKIDHYVVVSAVVTRDTGPETYVFLCDSEGEVLNWLELDGSFKGELNHSRALNGYLNCLLDNDYPGIDNL